MWSIPLYASFRPNRQSPHSTVTGELDLYVGATFLVGAHKRPLPFGVSLQARTLASAALLGTGAAFLLYVLLDETLAYYEELNDQLQGDIARLEERALRDNTDAFLTDLLAFKRYLYTLARLAEQHRPVFAAFGRPDFAWVAGAGPEIGAAFADLEAHLARLGDALSGREMRSTGRSTSTSRTRPTAPIR